MDIQDRDFTNEETDRLIKEVKQDMLRVVQAGGRIRMVMDADYNQNRGAWEEHRSFNGQCGVCIIGAVCLSRQPKYPKEVLESEDEQNYSASVISAAVALDMPLAPMDDVYLAAVDMGDNPDGVLQKLRERGRVNAARAVEILCAYGEFLNDSVLKRTQKGSHP